MLKIEINVTKYFTQSPNFDDRWPRSLCNQAIAITNFPYFSTSSPCLNSVSTRSGDKSGAVVPSRWKIEIHEKEEEEVAVVPAPGRYRWIIPIRKFVTSLIRRSLNPFSSGARANWTSLARCLSSVTSPPPSLPRHRRCCVLRGFDWPLFQSS